MKKIIIALISIILVLAICSCSNGKNDKGSESDTTEVTTEAPQTEAPAQNANNGTYTNGVFTQTLHNEDPVSWHNGNKWLEFNLNDEMKNDIASNVNGIFKVAVSFDVVHPKGWDLEQAYLSNLKKGGEVFYIVKNTTSLKSNSYTSFSGEFQIKGSLLQAGYLYLCLAGEPINLLGSDNDYSVKNAKITVAPGEAIPDFDPNDTSITYSEVLFDENPSSWRQGGKWVTFTLSEQMKAAIINNQDRMLNVKVSFEAIHPNSWELHKSFVTNLKEGGEKFIIFDEMAPLEANTYTKFEKEFQINTNLLRDGQIYLCVAGPDINLLGGNYSLKNANIFVSFAEIDESTSSTLSS